MSSWKYIQVTPTTETWERLTFSASADFINYLLSAYHGISMATALWQSAQAVEKYLKAIIKKNNLQLPPRVGGHDLITRWDLVKQNFSSETHLFTNDYDDFINELSTVNPSTRYSFSINIAIILFVGKFIQFCDDLRKIIFGSEYDQVGFRGLPNALLNQNLKLKICPVILTYGRCLRNL